MPINYQLIHHEYNQYKSKLGNAQSQPVPQPQAVHPAHAMMVEAMSRANQKPGDDHGTMILRAMADHLKRISPDVSSVHKQPVSPSHSGKAGE